MEPTRADFSNFLDVLMWLPQKIDRIEPLHWIGTIGAESVVVAVVGFLVSGMFIWRLATGRITNPYARQLAIGIVFVAAGNALHRSFWGLARLLEGAGWVGAYAAARENIGITVVFLGLLLVGYGFHLAPVLSEIFGKPWVFYYAAATFGAVAFLTWVILY